MKERLRCWAEVDLEALRQNLLWIREQVGPCVKIMTVVKADAYGHGLKQIAALLMQSGTDTFGVANLTEARIIRNLGPGWPVLMLGPSLPEERELILKENVWPTISSLEEAEAFSKEARKRGKTIGVHIKIDTGMGRLGVSHRQAFQLVQQVRLLPNLQIEGIYTHFSSAEDSALITRRQESNFKVVLNEVAVSGIHIPLIHCSNSGGLLFQNEVLGMNLVRPGLLVYGIVPMGKQKGPSLLKGKVSPALSFKARIGFIKQVPAGSPLSYGGTYVTKRKMRVATITAGYGDGYPRAGSNKAKVLIAGKRCSVVGRITMDQTLVDISNVPNASVGDEVILLGAQGRDEITASELAAWCGAIPWEILTGITYRVPRIYRGGHAS